MDIIDNTPPPNLPPIVLVHSPQGFWLRIATTGRVETRTLQNSETLPGAIAEAISLGFTPTAWVNAIGIIIPF